MTKKKDFDYGFWAFNMILFFIASVIIITLWHHARITTTPVKPTINTSYEEGYDCGADRIFESLNGWQPKGNEHEWYTHTFCGSLQNKTITTLRYDNTGIVFYWE